MKSLRFVFIPALIATCAAWLSCSFQQLSGGTDTETGGTRVAGLIKAADGSLASNTVVMLIPAGFNPVSGGKVSDSLTDTTDINGAYSIVVRVKGTYNLQAVSRDNRSRSLKCGILVTGDSVHVQDDTLAPPGSIFVSLPQDIDRINGYVYVPGTTIFVLLNGSTDTIVLDSVPAGIIPSINYSATNIVTSSVIRYDVSVESGRSTSVFNPSWLYACQLDLNTTITGANITGNVYGFPVLIRLNSINFNFSQAQTSGADIRFTKSDNTFLPYEIERWDSVNRRAEIWVKVDTIRGNDSTQSITMYWGNVNAADSSNGAAVFDTANGFQGVWHLGQPAGGIVPDATANGINATATATATAAGAIGTAQSFNGISGFVRASGPAADKLNFPENGAFSVSVWVKTNVLDSVFHGVVYKSNVQYGLQMRPKNEWEFLTYLDKSRWEMSRSPASDNLWHALAGVRNGSKQYLYVDGRCLDSSIVTLSTNLARAYDQPLDIGHCPDGGADPDRFFNGTIDEVRISNVANSADWIKLCYMNQKEQDALVKW